MGQIRSGLYQFWRANVWLWTEADPTAVLVLGSVSLVLTGIWLLFPWSTFPHSPIYMMLDHLAPEYAWGLLAVVIGVTTISAQTAHQAPVYRPLSFWGLVYYLVVCISVIRGNAASIGVPLFGTWVVGYLWVVTRLYMDVNVGTYRDGRSSDRKEPRWKGEGRSTQ